MSSKREIRRCLFGSAAPGFSGGFPSEAEIFCVFMWCENQASEGSSPSQVLDEVTKRLRDHWHTLGKVVQTSKAVKLKVKTVVSKAQKYDNCVHILNNEKLIHQKKANFRRIVDIELKNRTKPGVARVRNIFVFVFVFVIKKFVKLKGVISESCTSLLKCKQTFPFFRISAMNRLF